MLGSGRQAHWQAALQRPTALLLECFTAKVHRIGATGISARLPELKPEDLLGIVDDVETIWMGIPGRLRHQISK